MHMGFVVEGGAFQCFTTPPTPALSNPQDLCLEFNQANVQCCDDTETAHFHGHVRTTKCGVEDRCWEEQEPVLLTQMREACEIVFEDECPSASPKEEVQVVNDGVFHHEPVVLEVRGMCCAGELPVVREVLETFPQVARFQVTLSTRELSVWMLMEKTLETSTLMDALNEEYLDVVPTHTQSCGHTAISHKGHAHYLVPDTNNQLHLHRRNKQAATLTSSSKSSSSPKWSLFYLQGIDDQYLGFRSQKLVKTPALNPPLAAAPPLDPTRDISSTFAVKGVCCASEVPSVQSLFKNTPLVSNVVVNVVMKQVVVTHSASMSTASIGSMLTKGGFEATVLKDGSPSLVTSLFAVKGVCCSSEVPMVVSLFSSTAYVEDVQVLVVNRQVRISHNPKHVSALDLAGMLTKGGFEATVVQDGAGSRTSRTTPTRVAVLPEPHIMLAFVLWLVSWLSFVGTNEEGERTNDWFYLKYVALVCVALVGPRIAWKSLGALKKRVLDINVSSMSEK